QEVPYGSPHHSAVAVVPSAGATGRSEGVARRGGPGRPARRESRRARGHGRGATHVLQHGLDPCTTADAAGRRAPARHRGHAGGSTGPRGRGLRSGERAHLRERQHPRARGRRDAGDARARPGSGGVADVELDDRQRATGDGHGTAKPAGHCHTRRPSGRYPRTSPTWCENEPLHSDTARSPIPRLGNTPLSYVSTSPTPATVTNVRLIGAESTAATSSAQRACSAFTRSEAPAMLPRRRSIDALMAPRSTRTSATRRPFWNRSTGWCAYTIRAPSATLWASPRACAAPSPTRICWPRRASPSTPPRPPVSSTEAL